MSMSRQDKVRAINFTPFFWGGERIRTWPYTFVLTSQACQKSVGKLHALGAERKYTSLPSLMSYRIFSIAPPFTCRLRVRGNEIGRVVQRTPYMPSGNGGWNQFAKLGNKKGDCVHQVYIRSLRYAWSRSWLYLHIVHTLWATKTLGDIDMDMWVSIFPHIYSRLSWLALSWHCTCTSVLHHQQLYSSSYMRLIRFIANDEPLDAFSRIYIHNPYASSNIPQCRLI